MYGGIGMNANENERTLTCQFRNTAKDFTFLQKLNHLYGTNYTLSALFGFYSEINAKKPTQL